MDHICNERFSSLERLSIPDTVTRTKVQLIAGI
jgi:hypothetical protein